VETGTGCAVGVSRTRPVISDPQFEILDAVICAVAILVMDCFLTCELSSQVLFHDEAMFKEISVV
jgi:hypothetical protein